MTIPIVSAPRFTVQPVCYGKLSWNFSEMTNIAVEVEPHEFIYCDPDGAVQHTKQYGKTKPPNVTLKKPMDTDRLLWSWHDSVQLGNLGAKLDCTLSVYRAGSPDLPPGEAAMFIWFLQQAWPSKIDVSGMKAGQGEAGTLTVTFACDLIKVKGAKGFSTGLPFQ